MTASHPHLRPGTPAALADTATYRATVPARRLAACGPQLDAISIFIEAMHETGTTQDVLACIWECSRQNVSDILNRNERRKLACDRLDQLRDHPAGHACWLAFMRRHVERGGAALTTALEKESA